MEDTNVNSEMSELVHLAEEWAADPCEQATTPLYQTILKKAAILLINQLGIKTVTEYEQCFGKTEKSAMNSESSEEKIDIARDHETEVQLISPLPKEELQRLLKNGWPRISTSPVGKLTKEEFQNILKRGCSINSPLPEALLGSRRRTSMLASLCPMSPIVSESSKSPMKKSMMSEKKLPESTVSRRLFTTSTPVSKNAIQQRKPTPSNSLRSLKAERQPSVQRNIISRAFTPRPMNNEGPLENRASRLRRMSIEGQLRNGGGKDGRNSFIETLNASFSDLSLNSFR